MVEMVNAVSAGVRRSIDFFHLPVPKPRTDDAFFAPLDGLNLRPDTELYLGLVHRDDMAGNAARLAGARRHARVDGVATECGMARGDPERFPALLPLRAGVVFAQFQKRAILHVPPNRLADRLRVKGWQVPAYPLPANCNDIVVQRIVARLGLGLEGVLDSGLPSPIPPTIYARIGDIPAAIVVAAAFIFAIRRRVAKRAS